MRACQSRADPDVLADKPRSGRPSIRDDTLRNLLNQWLAESPEEHGYPANSWTVPLLAEQFRHVRGEQLSEDTLREELHQLGYTWKRARYVLEPDPEREKKTPDSQTFEAVGTPACDSGGG
jgi:transposase